MREAEVSSSLRALRDVPHVERGIVEQTLQVPSEGEGVVGDTEGIYLTGEFERLEARADILGAALLSVSAPRNQQGHGQRSDLGEARAHEEEGVVELQLERHRLDVDLGPERCRRA